MGNPMPFNPYPVWLQLNGLRAAFILYLLLLTSIIIIDLRTKEAPQ